MLRRVLVANRGEIAVRVLRTCRRMGLATVAVYSDADTDAPHVALADSAVRIGPAPAAQSYLDIESIVAAAQRTGADAVHPGYGFLSENPALPEALDAAGIAFVGPRADVIRLMGDKAAAKRTMTAAGVPVVPGIDDPDLSDDELLARLDEVGYPLLLKAVAGGGGKGMRAVHDPEDAPAALAAAKREAANAFGDDRMIVERLVADPRHVEVQIIGDTHGNIIHVLERDCSLQRRHQKVVEEAPAAHLDDDVRARLHQAGVDAAAAVNYTGAGTVEFLLDANGQDFYFLEMNTRLQVEHPVTELITGLDLVELQLRVAAGEPLAIAQGDITPDGHAIEVRVYAEDPAVGFLPQTGTVRSLSWPQADDVRVDSGIENGSEVSPHYDPMLAKLVVHADDRTDALQRLREAVRATSLLGVRTNLEWLGDLLDDPAVKEDRITTAWLDKWAWDEPPAPPSLLAYAAVTAARRSGPIGPPAADTSPFDALGPLRTGGGGWVVHLADRDDVHRLEVRFMTTTMPEVHRTLDLGADEREQLSPPRTARASVIDGRVWVHAEGRTRLLEVVPATRHLDLDAASGDAALTSPMPGSVVTVEVAEGDEVTKGQTLLVVEAMKMEHPVTAPTDGTIVDLAVGPGDAVDAGQALVTVHPTEDE